MTYLLIVILLSGEAYVIDHDLSRDDCDKALMTFNERLNEYEETPVQAFTCEPVFEA